MEMKMKMKTICGDITQQRGILVHQVNCQKTMGAGLALRMKTKFPQHYQDYLAHAPELGSIVVSELRPDLVIAGLYAQDKCGISRVQTDYRAFEACLQKLKKVSGQYPQLPVYFPSRIGCGLAGGNWNIIQSYLRLYFPQGILVQYRPAEEVTL